MQAALKLKTTILPGHRIEVTAPELPEYGEVELIIVLPESVQAVPEAENVQGVWDYIQSLPPVQRTPAEWAAVERELQEEKDAWER